MSEILIDLKVEDGSHQTNIDCNRSKKIPAQVQQPHVYTNNRSIEPVNYVRNNHFVWFLFLCFRSVLFHVYYFISCSFVKVLAHKQYKYARKIGSTVVNCPAKPSVQC